MPQAKNDPLAQFKTQKVEDFGDSWLAPLPTQQQEQQLEAKKQVSKT
jgi:hypothetical protein